MRAAGSWRPAVGESGPTMASPIAPTRAAALTSASWGGSSRAATPSSMTAASASR